MAKALQAEYWAVSSKTGFGVDDLFVRVAALTFNVSLSNEGRQDTKQRTIGDQLSNYHSFNSFTAVFIVFFF